MQLLGITVTKNDEWYIQRSLPRLAECTDGVVVVDDGSTDGTYEILQSCPKVQRIIRNPPGERWQLFRDGKRLVKAIEDFDPEWIMLIDSDDVIDTRFSVHRDELLSNPDVGRYHFREVTLWRSTQHYRIDHPEKWGRTRGKTPYLLRVSPTWILGNPYTRTWRSTLYWWLGRQWPVAYVRRRVNPTCRLASAPRNRLERMVSGVIWPEDYLNFANLQPIGDFGNEFELPLVKLHYHYANWDAAWRKHMYYALNSALLQMRSPGEIPHIVNWATKNLFDDVELAEVDKVWGVIP